MNVFGVIMKNRNEFKFGLAVSRLLVNLSKKMSKVYMCVNIIW
jgi:hypothetical protein